MSKFKVKYYYIQERTEEVEAKHDAEAIKKFREEHETAGISSVQYVYEGNDEPKEWFCHWWNGNTWKSKIVMAHNEDEIIYNIKESLDFAVYDFRCCLNTEEEKSSLYRSLID